MCNSLIQHKMKLIVLTGLMLLSNIGFSQDIFVSPHGNDAGNGSKKAPYATIKRALKAVAGSGSDGTKHRATINLRGGTYSINRTINIDSALSNVTIQAYRKEKVVLFGGVNIPVTNIRPANLPMVNDTHKKIYAVNLKEIGITNYGKVHSVGFSHPYRPSWGEIFINGKPMRLSGWPNQGMVPMGKVLDKGSIPRNKDFANRGGVIKYDSLRINKWAKEKDAWMAGYFMLGYADDMVSIKNIDTSKETITTASATMYGYGHGHPWTRWFGVNILSELDDPGEYYIDREKGMLYFMYADKEIKSLTFSVLESPFIILGKTSHVTISGITFECSRGLGIAMDNTTNVTIRDCTFRNLGSLGITIGKGAEPLAHHYIEGVSAIRSGIIGSLQENLYANTTLDREGGQHNKITGCEFYQLGAGGVILGGGNKRTLEAGNNVVENCLFHDFTRIEKTYRPAVYITGAGNKVQHCEIYNTPNMALYLHGNNHLIAYNYIHNVCLEIEDQGAIYVGRDPSDRGSLIYHNYIANIPDKFATRAIYEDDGTCGVDVIGNVFYKAGTWNVFVGGGSDNITRNNIFIENKTGVHVDNRMENWLHSLLEEGGLFRKRLAAVDYLNLPYITAYPPLKKYLDKAAVPTGNLIENNVFVKVGKLTEGKRDWMDYKRNNWATNIDPGFVNWKKQNFSLKPGSVIYKELPAFEEIPFSKIGRYKDRHSLKK